MVQLPVKGDKHDRLKQLRSFCYAASLGSITEAAKRVHLSQPSMSNQIRSLEEKLGVALLIRRGPKFSLTPAGQALHRRAQLLVEQIDRLPDTFEEQYRDCAGPLLIAAGETAASFLLLRIFKAYMARHPNTEVDTRVGSGTACLSWLREYEVDIALVAMDIESREFEFRSLVASHYELITPLGHPLARLKSAGPRDLTDYPMIAHTQQRFIRVLGEAHLRQHGVVPNVVVDVDGWETIKSYVEAGLGIAIIPGLCLTERDHVCRVPYEGTLPAREYGIVTRRERILPLAVQRFCRVLDSLCARPDSESPCRAR